MACPDYHNNLLSIQDSEEITTDDNNRVAPSSDSSESEENKTWSLVSNSSLESL